MKIKPVLIAALLLALGIQIAPIPSSEASIATCPGDYYGFIVKARSPATRKQTFQDFFSLGYCQLSDIMALEDELNTLRDAFRSAAESCGDTSEYKKQYTAILMEEYFVRHIQDSPSDVLNEEDVEKLAALKEVKLEALRREMKALFVDEEKRTDENTFETYFANWSSKYSDRIANYAHCEEGAWAQLNATVEDFADDIHDLGIDVQKEEFSFSGNTSVSADEGIRNIGKTIQNAYRYLTAKRELAEAELEAPQSVSDLSSSGEVFSFQEALQTLNRGTQEFSIETNAADRMAHYEILYGTGGAVAATNMQSTLVYMNQTLETMNTEDLPNIARAAAQIYDKQCR